MQGGLEVINDDGILQVSGSYRNYVLQSKFTMVGTLVQSYPREGYFYEFTAPGGSMVACQPVEGTPITLFTTAVNGSTTTYSFVTPVASGTPQCTFYIFNLLISPPAVNAGLEVYDELGRLCFSSSNSYMSPVATWSGRSYLDDLYKNGTGPYTEWIISSGRPRASHAVVFGGPSGYWQWQSVRVDENYFESDEDVYACMVYWKGNNLFLTDGILAFRWQRSTSPFNHGYSYLQYYLMLVDVSQFI